MNKKNCKSSSGEAQPSQDRVLGPSWTQAAAALAGALFFPFAGPGHAADTNPHASEKEADVAGSFTFENDLFFKSDHYYTDGVQLTIKQQNLNEVGLLGHWAFEACELLVCPSTRVDELRHKFGQLMYTPTRITVSTPQPFDRPWAGCCTTRGNTST